MKILLDENVAISLKDELIKCGFVDVIHINDVRKGMKDSEVYELAKREKRLIISGDNHFKRSEFKFKCGVIFLTPRARGLEDLPTKIKWIVDNISNYNIDVFSSSISLTYQEYNIFYEKGMKHERKNKEIPYTKIKFNKMDKIRR